MVYGMMKKKQTNKKVNKKKTEKHVFDFMMNYYNGNRFSMISAVAFLQQWIVVAIP